MLRSAAVAARLEARAIVTRSSESVNSWVLNVLDRESRKILEDV